MMYFLQPGTDWRQYGDLFKPYLEDFNRIFEKPTQKQKKYVYASYDTPEVMCRGRHISIYKENLRENAEGNPKMFMQNGTWCYYVTLPIDKVWTFEIDDTTPAVISPLSGLMITYSQQSDYEAAQLSLLLNPLIKIFTGEIPYFKEDGTGREDGYRLSNGGRMMFETLFNTLMSINNTGGTAIYSAPFENIKSHDFSESANANEISESFNRYGMEKAGLAAILPATDDVKASQVDSSMRIESRYATVTIYPQFCRMMNELYRSLHLQYSWEFKMFGTIFDEDRLRENALKAIANGDISQHFILSALEGNSWLDKLAMMSTIKESGILDMLIPPVTSYTMKQESGGGLTTHPGRRKKEGIPTDAKEKAIDAGIVKK